MRGKPEALDVTGKLIAGEYMEGDPLAVAAFHQHFDYLSSGIAGLINLFSPQKIVIGGGISESTFYVKEIAARVKRKIIPVCGQHTIVVAAELGNKAGLLGCGAKVFTVFTPDRMEV